MLTQLVKNSYIYFKKQEYSLNLTSWKEKKNKVDCFNKILIKYIQIQHFNLNTCKKCLKATDYMQQNKCICDTFINEKNRSYETQLYQQTIKFY